MSYGLTFEQIAKVNKPQGLVEPWGQAMSCTGRNEFSFYRIEVKAGQAMPSCYMTNTRAVYFVEEGEVIAKQRNERGEPQHLKLAVGSVYDVAQGAVHGFYALKNTVLYAFSNKVGDSNFRFAETYKEAQSYFGQEPARWSDVPMCAGKTTDFRDKYWGSIESIVSDDFAGKKIFLKKGGQSSLEFHCQKTESYYVHSGKVKVGLRIGRGENKSLVLNAGESFDIIPGLMHMRIALEDSVIIEISTRDSDSDSYLVEDGKTYKHVEV